MDRKCIRSLSFQGPYAMSGMAPQASHPGAPNPADQYRPQQTTFTQFPSGAAAQTSSAQGASQQPTYAHPSQQNVPGLYNPVSNGFAPVNTQKMASTGQQVIFPKLLISIVGYPCISFSNCKNTLISGTTERSLTFLSGVTAAGYAAIRSVCSFARWWKFAMACRGRAKCCKFVLD